MIVQVTAENEALLTRFFSAHTHPQLTKIACRHRAYGIGYDFCRFFLCSAQGEVTAAVSLFGDSVQVYTTGGECAELTQWIGMLPVSAASVNAAGRELFCSPRVGSIFLCEPGEQLPAPTEGKLDDAFAILRRAFGEELYNGESYSGWYCDMSHNIRHGVSRVYVEGDATVTALCMTESQVVLSQVAVLPSAQGKGAGRELVRRAAAQFPGRQVFVYSRNPGTDVFYRRAGFKYFEDWIEV